MALSTSMMAQGRGGTAPAAAVQTPVAAATTSAAAPAVPARFTNGSDQVLKALEIQDWYSQMGDLAEIHEIRYTSLPPHYVPNPTAPGAKNPMIITAIIFIPKSIDRKKKQPFIVFVHQGIHADFGSDYEYGAVRELLEQGYPIIAPDYRGSTGHGLAFYNAIDYGGSETEDVFLARAWMLENYEFLDENRVGIIGWSHGGMITLNNILHHPGAYAAAFAGVPVTDVILQVGMHDAAYQAGFSAPSHIGKTVAQDIEEYRKRSPVTYADNLITPLLIHGNTNDEQVSVIQQQELITALKAAGKKFEYKIYEDAPGGHEFGRLDTKIGKESRHDLYVFLARYLKPERPVH